MSRPCHAIERARERYGLELCDEDLRVIAARIGDGRSVHLGTSGNGGERHALAYGGKTVVVVWLPAVEAIATFLPLWPGVRT